MVSVPPAAVPPPDSAREHTSPLGRKELGTRASGPAQPTALRRHVPAPSPSPHLLLPLLFLASTPPPVWKYFKMYKPVLIWIRQLPLYWSIYIYEGFTSFKIVF